MGHRDGSDTHSEKGGHRPFFRKVIRHLVPKKPSRSSSRAKSSGGDTDQPTRAPAQGTGVTSNHQAISVPQIHGVDSVRGYTTGDVITDIPPSTTHPGNVLASAQTVAYPAALPTVDTGVHRNPRTTTAGSSNTPLKHEVEQNIGQSKERKSCFDLALERLKVENEKVYGQPSKTNQKMHGMMENPRAVLEKAEVQISERQSKGKEILEHTIRHLHVLKDTSIAIAQLDPFKIAPLGLRVLFVMMEATLAEATLDKDMVRNISEASVKVAYWLNVEYTYLITYQSEVSDSLARLNSSIVDFCSSIIEWEVGMLRTDPGFFVRVGKAFYHQSKWQDLIKTIDSRNAICDKEFSMFKDTISKQTEILKWISEVDPRREFQNKLDQTQVEERYSNCGQWFFDRSEFQSWSRIEHPNDRRILWLSGTVGTGKTTLITRIIQWHLDRPTQYAGRRLAYAFCSRGMDLKNKSSYKAILSFLLRQATYDSTTGKVFEDVLKTYNDFGGSQGAPGPLSLSETIKLFRRVLSSGIRLRVIIDALDECDNPQELLRHLREVSRNSRENFELLVSSRNEVEVDKKFMQLSRVKLDSFNSGVDMMAYIKTEVMERDDDQRLLEGRHKELEERLIDVLFKKAGGMFRWVQLQISLFLNPNRKLRHPDDVKALLNKLENGETAGEMELNEAYNEIFDRNTGAGAEHSCRHAEKLYKILLCLESDITMPALAHAVSFQHDASTSTLDDTTPDFDLAVDVNYIRHISMDLVVEKSNGFVALSHISVKDYLQGGGLKSRSPVEFEMLKCKTQMARTCLNFIIFYSYDSIPERTIDGYYNDHDFVWFALESWGGFCAQLGETDRGKSGISEILLDWMARGRGRKAFRDFLGDSSIQPYLQGSAEYWMSHSRSAIFAACDQNLIEVSRELIRISPDCIELRNKSQETPLFVASMSESLETIKLLLSLGAKVERAGPNGMSALHCIIDPQIATLLLGKFPLLVNSLDNDGYTPLFYLVRPSHLAYIYKHTCTKMIHCLVTRNAAVDCQDDEGLTPLMYASQIPRPSTITSLISHGANLEQRDNAGNTSLLHAAQSWSLRNIRLLIDLKAQADAKDFKGRNSLHTLIMSKLDQYGYSHVEHAVAEMELLTVVTLLVDHGCSIVEEDDDGDQPIHKFFHPTTRLNSLRLAKCTLACMLDAGADIVTKNRKGDTLLDIFLRFITIDFDGPPVLGEAVESNYLLSIFTEFLEHKFNARKKSGAEDIRDCDIATMERIKEIIGTMQWKRDDLPGRIITSLGYEEWNRAANQGENLRPFVFSWSSSLEMLNAWYISSF